MITNINELYEEQKEIWEKENEHYFGITPLNKWTDPSIVEEHLKVCAEKFWNNGTNEMKKLFENGRCNDIDKLVPGSYELIFDSKNGLICLFATFEYEVDSFSSDEKEKKQKRSPLAYFPYANDLCWFLGDTEYVLRISANFNYSLITRQGKICKYQKTWTYNITTKKFNVVLEDFDPYEDLTLMNRRFLEGCYGQELTKENFEDALASIPEFDGMSLIYFKFGHLEEMFRVITKSARFANPLKKVPIPINTVKMFSSQKNMEEAQKDGSFNNLVISNGKLFALENSRTIIYKTTFQRNFNFTDSEKFFDAFKTSTNKSAGRSRLLLDTVIVKDQMLWNKADGEYKNMYELIADKDYKVDDNLSVLSCSSFSSNNDPKRIMMTAKLRTQAIPTKAEIDSFTHETPARIVFGDFEGFNYGDSIIISRSFARKLESHCTQRRKLRSYNEFLELNKKYNIGDMMSIDDFNKVVGSTMCANYRDIILDEITPDYITISARIPFSIGDKITNLHGSKGIVSLIFEDEEMPYLKEDIVCGDHVFKAGPFEVIVSALSVYRRKSLGQLFEAWALASGMNGSVKNIQDAIARYSSEMKSFSEQSIICWNGKETIKPCGINMFLRLNHNAVAKQSHSYVKTNYAKMLKFGEMEYLNLAARGLYDIMNELDIRSVSKHYDSLGQIKMVQETGKLRSEPANNLRFFSTLRAIGFNFNLCDVSSNVPYSDFAKLQSLLTDDQIELFEGGKE